MRPTERALVDDRKEITWAEFADRVHRCAAALEVLELKRGERIGIHGLNSIELAVTILACWRAGLVTVLLSPVSKGPELAQELSASGAVAYLGDGDLYPVGELVLGRCPTMRLGLLLRRGAIAPEVVAQFSSGARVVEPMPVPPPGLAVIMFSSGTTGIPKGGCYEIRFGKSSIHCRKRRIAFFSFRSRYSVRTNIQCESTSILTRVSSTFLLPLQNSSVRRSHHSHFFPGFVRQRQALAPNFVTPSKGVMHTHASLAAAARPIPDTEFAGPIGVLYVTPFAYNPYLLCHSLGIGHTLVLLRWPDPEMLLEALATHRCHMAWFLTPAFCQRVLDAQRARRRDTSSCLSWYAVGDAVPKHLLDAWPDHFGKPLCQAYGQTEFCGGFRNAPPWNRPGSLGLPFHGTEARLVDEMGRECGVGEVGELLLRSPTMFAGYWNDPQTTAAVMQDGWFRTGDLVYRDADGYYWFRGRLKQIITCDGEKISPQHVESALLEHPDVVEAGVVGRPDELHGEVPVAFVRLRPGASVVAATLREFVSTRVEDCGVPEEIRFVEALPRGRTGKVDRSALREQAVKRAPSAIG